MVGIESSRAIARQAVLWARTSRRRLLAAEAMDDARHPALALERYGEWLQGLQALHSALAAARSLMHGDPLAGAPLDPAELASLHVGVAAIRRLAAVEVKRLPEPASLALHLEGGELVARDGVREARLSLDAWRRAVDAIEAWAGRYTGIRGA